MFVFTYICTVVLQRTNPPLNVVYVIIQLFWKKQSWYTKNVTLSVDNVTIAYGYIDVI